MPFSIRSIGCLAIFEVFHVGAGLQIPDAGDLQLVLSLVGFQSFFQLLVHLIFILAARLHDAISHKNALKHLNVVATIVESNVRISVPDGSAVAVNQLVIVGGIVLVFLLLIFLIHHESYNSPSKKFIYTQYNLFY